LDERLWFKNGGGEVTEEERSTRAVEHSMIAGK
jgi:hypothetical protein